MHKSIVLYLYIDCEPIVTIIFVPLHFKTLFIFNYKIYEYNLNVYYLLITNQIN